MLKSFSETDTINIPTLISALIESLAPTVAVDYTDLDIYWQLLHEQPLGMLNEVFTNR